MSRSEKESIRELVLKNETKGQGDVYIEGSIKQLKNLMRNHLVVKPACMFDSSIKVSIQVMFAQNGKYSEKNKREVQLDLAQVIKPSSPSELNHQFKYRFMQMAENGAITPLYDPTQTVEGGGGDLLLKFYGPAGSGFEFCEISPQSLTRGSQY